MGSTRKGVGMVNAQAIAWVLAVGMCATLVLDIWLLAIARLGVPTFDFAMLGRWVGHASRGQLASTPIARAPSIRGERTLGWALHYAIGVGFASMLLAWQGWSFA